MRETRTPQEAWQHLHELLEGFDHAMLITHTADGGMRGRPMAVADARDHGVLYFATAIDSPKVDELLKDPRVCVCLQDDARYVSLSGHARLITEPGLIESLWSDAWRVWFPEGKDDPSLCVLEVEPEEAEYWDQSGAKGLRYLFEAARAYVAGERPRTDAERHGKVRS